MCSSSCASSSCMRVRAGRRDQLHRLIRHGVDTVRRRSITDRGHSKRASILVGVPDHCLASTVTEAPVTRRAHPHDKLTHTSLSTRRAYSHDELTHTTSSPTSRPALSAWPHCARQPTQTRCQHAFRLDLLVLNFPV